MVFDNDMFRDQMTKLHINTQRMPLGKLSKQQIAKGFKALGQYYKGFQDISFYAISTAWSLNRRNINRSNYRVIY